MSRSELFAIAIKTSSMCPLCIAIYIIISMDFFPSETSCVIVLHYYTAGRGGGGRIKNPVNFYIVCRRKKKTKINILYYFAK